MSSFNIFWCISNTTIPTDLRGYVTSTTPLLPDGMVSFAVCTAQLTAIPATVDLSANNSLILDALTFYVLPGDPSSDIYNDQLPDQFTSMAYGVGRVSGGPQILDGDHSSRVVTVGVADYVRGDTKASAVRSTSTPSAPVTPVKRRKFEYPSPSSAPGPSTSVSMATFTSSHSYLSMATAPVPDPISTGDPMYYHPQYFAGIPPALGLPAQSLSDAGLFSIQVAFPWLLPLQVKGILSQDANSSSKTTFSQQHCSAHEPADSGVDHTVKHTHTYSNIHRISDLIDFRDCVVKWTRPKPPSA
ncbi:hypothetical protein DFH08DRAFT_945087 [Mycena albidolilacea]|uniref:Uncharacterized protein n=1 Tax=Mycena albidolilacea TaxID=1033008 RepID=A0AAD6Z2M2_9AGAR|nr:hypothetical protein DFH08DRAFT_945087 [Mycena albidolilacea]